MQPSHFFKNILNSDSIQEALEHIRKFANVYLECDHVCLFINDQDVTGYSVNIRETELKSIHLFAKETDYFSLFPEDRNIHSVIYLQRKGISEHTKFEMRRNPFRSMFSFQLKYGSYHGTIVFCYPDLIHLTENMQNNCHLIRLQIEHLMEKIHFRTQLLKQTVFENLFNALRIKDGFTVNHSYNVSYYASLLGIKLGLSCEDLELLKTASILHDIGKLGIPKQVLLKPGKLNDEEFQIIREHPAIGFKLLKNYEHVERILPIVRWHHERIDGKGYPDRLAETEIPYLVRIVSLVDAFDAMTSTRVYRNPLNIDEVKKQLLIHAGTQFDECMTKAFLEVINEHIKTKPYALLWKDEVV
jgi:putative nucleotidyltransferase with HDIG domain